MAVEANGWLRPDWPAPPRVQAVSTTRLGGISQPPYDQLNLALHVGDDPACVLHNRDLLRTRLELPAAPCWLEQVHGKVVVDAAICAPGTNADGSYTNRPNVVCAVLTADCLPVLFTTREGTGVAAAHAGWRGLVAGVLEETVDSLCRATSSSPAALLAWLGPAIGPGAFEVGAEVRQAFIERDPACAVAFVANRPGHYLADLYALARLLLQRHGVDAVYGGGLCTFSEAGRFYSYRRTPRTGRMASCIWMVA